MTKGNYEFKKRCEGLSQRKVAAMLGCSQPHVCRMQANKTPKTLDLALRIQEAFGVDLNWWDIELKRRKS